MTTEHHLDTEFPYVAIIDFLPDCDRKEFQVATKVCALLNRYKIPWHYLTCHGKQSLISAIRWLGVESKKQQALWIHFVGHGKPSGLEMPDDREPILEWRILAPAFRQFSPDALGRTVLNMSCCYGLHGIKIVDCLPPDRSFFGILGPVKPIGFNEAIKLNSKVYRKMVEGKSVNEIVREVNREFGKEIFYGLPTAGYRMSQRT